MLLQIQDVPKLLSKLQLQQSKPDVTCFKQLLDSLTHLMALKEAFTSLAPTALGSTEDEFLQVYAPRDSKCNTLSADQQESVHQWQH